MYRVQMDVKIALGEPSFGQHSRDIRACLKNIQRALITEVTSWRGGGFFVSLRRNTNDDYLNELSVSFIGQQTGFRSAFRAANAHVRHFSHQPARGQNAEAPAPATAAAAAADRLSHLANMLAKF